MGMHNDFCVGCGYSVSGEYRPDANWDLCPDCYKDWLENEPRSLEIDFTLYKKGDPSNEA